jgi:hypothetical protein
MDRIELDNCIVYDAWLTAKDGTQLSLAVFLHNDGTITGSVTTTTPDPFKVLAELETQKNDTCPRCRQELTDDGLCRCHPE